MLAISINNILILTSIVFSVGLLGIALNRKNVLVVIMSIELLLLAVNLNFSTISVYLDDMLGQIFVLFVLAIAATESAVGLALLTVSYRLKSSIRTELVKRKPTSKI